MKLIEYEAKIEEIQASAMGKAAKATALNMIADEINRCAWQGPYQNWAYEVAGLAREASNQFGGTSLEGLDSLAEQGLIEPRYKI